VQSVARLVWEDAPVAGLDADRLLSAQSTPEEREEAHDAESFLRELLTGGDVAAKEGEQAGARSWHRSTHSRPRPSSGWRHGLFDRFQTEGLVLDTVSEGRHIIEERHEEREY